jgi:hypothetical protein
MVTWRRQSLKNHDIFLARDLHIGISGTPERDHLQMAVSATSGPKHHVDFNTHQTKTPSIKPNAVAGPESLFKKLTKPSTAHAGAKVNKTA